MKRQIRKKIFETNSSSTHSLQIEKGDTDEIIIDLIKQYLDSHEISDYYPEIYVDDDGNQILNIKGLPFENGEESKCVYGIVESWLGKIQYIGALIYQQKDYIKEIEEAYDKLEDYRKKNNLEYRDYMLSDMYVNIPKVSSTELYKAFVDAVMESASKKGVTINKINYLFDDSDDCYEKYVENLDGNPYFSKKTMQDVNKFKESVYKLLEDGTSMIYMDEAYDSYEGPIIKIY